MNGESGEIKDGWQGVTATKLSCGHEVERADQPHYCEYIGVAQLEALGNPYPGTAKERPAVHQDEHQFVAVHQVCELMFLQVIYNLRLAIALVKERQLTQSMKMVERVIAWVKQVRTAMKPLDTMTPSDFETFRALLSPASGAESANARRIDLLAGIRADTPYVKVHDHVFTYRQYLDRAPNGKRGSPSTLLWIPEFTQMCQEASLASAVQEVLDEYGVTYATLYDFWDRQNRSSWQAMPDTWNYRPGELDLLKNFCDRLGQFDAEFTRYRQLHVEIVRKQIGNAEGTGHSIGLSALKYTADNVHFFPELWQVRQQRVDEARPSGKAWSGE